MFVLGHPGYESNVKGRSGGSNADSYGFIVPLALCVIFQGGQGFFLQFWEGALGPFRLGKLAW